MSWAAERPSRARDPAFCEGLRLASPLGPGPGKTHQGAPQRYAGAVAPDCRTEPGSEAHGERHHLKGGAAGIGEGSLTLHAADQWPGVGPSDAREWAASVLQAASPACVIASCPSAISPSLRRPQGAEPGRSQAVWYWDGSCVIGLSGAACPGELTSRQAFRHFINTCPEVLLTPGGRVRLLGARSACLFAATLSVSRRSGWCAT